MTKDTAIIIALPVDLKQWIDEQASDLGLESVAWVRMQLFHMRKRGPAVQVVDIHGPAIIDTGPPSDTEAPVDMAALVDGALAEADAAGLTAPREEDIQPQLAANDVRPIIRPAPRYAPNQQPAWLAGI